MSDSQTNEQAVVVEMVAETMTGDLVSAIVDEIKAAPDCWPKLSQEQQDDVIQRATSRVRSNVREAVRIIAADGRSTITATLEQITAKDGIKAVCNLGKHDPNRHELLDAVGKAVLLVVADAEQFSGGELPTSDADQPDLPLADGAGIPPSADAE